VQVPDSEGQANHAGPESCAGVGDGVGEALTGEGAGRVVSPEIVQSWVPTRSEHAAGHTVDAVMARCRRTRRGRRPLAGTETLCAEPVMHGCRASDRFIVPMKPSNEGCPREPAEKVEGRERAKGKVAQQSRGQTQSQVLPVTGARPRPRLTRGE
jgi:hypothetical protein